MWCRNRDRVERCLNQVSTTTTTRVATPHTHRRDERRAISCSDRGRGWGILRCKAKASASVARQVHEDPLSKRCKIRNGSAFERVSRRLSTTKTR